MDVNAPRGLLRAFETLEDPRMNRTKKHQLSDIVMIAICAIICGADGWTQIVKFGRAKLEWFKTFLALPNGIPSHDTFGRVFAALNPDAFERCFVTWVRSLSAASDGRLIAIDGKTIRRSLDAASDKASIHMVSAWCETNHLVLGQVAVDDKTNEIKVIPELLKLLDLDGAIVTIDAMGCQKDIARQIVEQDGNYILHLKGNQGTLHDETVQLFDECLTDDCLGIAYETASTTDKGHGRIEQRRLWVTNEVNWFAERGKWKNLRSLIRVQCTRTVGDITTSEYHYYISSLKVAAPDKINEKDDDTAIDAATFLRYVREHWGVENGLHWCLDIAFADDQRRMRKGYAAENFARLARIALNLLKSETTNDGGLKTKRLCCGWDHDYLLKVLTQGIKEI
jgi:predicted transposase YbfD/YdcC